MSSLESITDYAPSIPAWWSVVTAEGLFAVWASNQEEAVMALGYPNPRVIVAKPLNANYQGSLDDLPPGRAVVNLLPFSRDSDCELCADKGPNVFPAERRYYFG